MNKGYFLVFLTAIISGLSIFLSKFGVSVINPYIFTWLKNLMVLVLLTGLLLALKDWQILKSLTKKQWFLLIAIGLVGGSIPFLLFFKGLSMVSAPLGSFIHKTMFIYVAFLAFFFLKEKIDKRFFLGGFFLILGNLLLLKKLSFTLEPGYFLVFLATFFWAAENTISKYVLKELSGRIVAWARMFFGAFFIFIFLLGTDQLSLLVDFNLIQVRWILITAVFLFGYVMTWYGGLRYIPVSQATVILLFGAPITTLLSFIFGREVILQDFLAGFLIILGIISVLGLKQTLGLIKEMKTLMYVRT
ncbi:MAG: hypothetical protein A2Z78_01550 [Candidatus Nealsonbacteria bacterium RBG_13_36_15]|uniref:EamA domain-containing protein n=1 Tax=Candidatus Nealsonbacteria bacterium RBG_13_36_15 TaxID=1801660 RepID=A0A1G2DVA0_9BACT|nr:MAG: hypothetical protein A2Z78_01550 [Candidatus Nealsonbacteria bacterium RBG_13_36_15]